MIMTTSETPMSQQGLSLSEADQSRHAWQGKLETLTADAGAMDSGNGSHHVDLMSKRALKSLKWKDGQSRA